MHAFFKRQIVNASIWPDWWPHLPNMLAACHWGVKNPLNIYKVEIMDRIAPSPYNIQSYIPTAKDRNGFPAWYFDDVFPKLS